MAIKRKQRRFRPLLLAGLAVVVVGLLALVKSSVWASQTDTGGASSSGRGSAASGGGGGSNAAGSSSSSNDDSASSRSSQGERSVCSDTCEGFARNGVCDEGRRRADAPPGQQPDSQAIFPVHCDLGTDCADCGPWVRACSFFLYFGREDASEGPGMVVVRSHSDSGHAWPHAVCQPAQCSLCNLCRCTTTPRSRTAGGR